LLEALTRETRVISSQAQPQFWFIENYDSKLELGRFRDYPEREYCPDVMSEWEAPRTENR